MEKGQGKGKDTLPITDGFAHKEYIERNEALKKLLQCADVYDPECSDITVAHAMRKISAISAADVVPVRHGRWVKVDNLIYYHMECSLCHEKPLRNRWVDSDELSPYCPNCGAKMDKNGDA